MTRATVTVITETGTMAVQVPTLADPVWRTDDGKIVAYPRIVQGQPLEVRAEVDNAAIKAISGLVGEAVRYPPDAECRRLCAGAARLLGEIAGEVGDHSRTPAP